MRVCSGPQHEGEVKVAKYGWQLVLAYLLFLHWVGEVSHEEKDFHIGCHNVPGSRLLHYVQFHWEVQDL